jgi:hypothetical protein
LSRGIFRIGVILTALAAAPAAGAFVHARARMDARVGTGATLVQLANPGDALSPALRRAGARLVVPGMDVWRLPADQARSALPALRAEGVVLDAEPDQKVVQFTHLSQGDPLIPNEWWITDVGFDQTEPPPPGVPITVIDTGLDMTHPEFASRPNTKLLNPQFVVSKDDVHGTAVSSIVGAPSNGIGLVGIYPQANLQEWDFGDGSLSDILAGLSAASKLGRGVVNFSGGFLGYSALLEQGIDRALHRGTIVVAAVGNDRQSGNRPFVPATLPHVLTVGANDQSDHSASFSNRSGALDLVAPGVAMPVAVPTFYNSTGYDSFDGTSFSAPLVAGATAWIWTLRPQLDVTQIQDVMRDSARDIGPTGWDADTGFGILSVGAAQTVRTRAKDPQEPNDDINLVRPHAVTASGSKLTTPTTIGARMDVTEDPEDVYRVWVPAHRRIAARTRSRANVDLALWGAKTRTVFERGATLRRDLLDFSQKTGSRSDLVTGQNKNGHGVYFYVDAFLGKRVGQASYSLNVSVARR